ncbi:MAG: hypothetical protein IPF54_08280 [Draconibacterium sp.]|nr:hypothetical protein [Draconibacterium sp.]
MFVIVPVPPEERIPGISPEPGLWVKISWILLLKMFVVPAIADPLLIPRKLLFQEVPTVL